MNCPKCEGAGWVEITILATAFRWSYTDVIPCDHPGCHAGQVSCSEGELRDEAAN